MSHFPKLEPIIMKIIDKEISHPTHPHHKLRLEYTETPFNCDGCKEPGIGLKYSCRRCDFDLHRTCAMARHAMTHPFYDRCEFRLHHVPVGPTRRACDACRDEVLGFVYHCHRCDFDLHPCCANLPKALDDGARNLYLRHKLPGGGACHTCGVGQSSGAGWAYVSGCGTYGLHLSCVKEMLVESWLAESLNVDKDKVGLVRTRIPRLNGTLSHRRDHWKVRKFCEIAGEAVHVIVSAILGDPTALIGSVVGGFMSK